MEPELAAVAALEIRLAAAEETISRLVAFAQACWAGSRLLADIGLIEGQQDSFLIGP
jgi:hypothetical protein